MSREKGRNCNLQHYATKKDICLRRCITSLCAGAASPRVLCAVLGTQCKKDINLLASTQRGATKMVNILEEELYENG